MSESELTHLLAQRYAAPEFAFLSQVRNGTGFSRRTTRTADGIAMGLYPSRGIHLHGFEIKVSRSDFNAELKNPDKAEDIARFCNHWWIVAPSVKEAPVELVPAGWGLLVQDGAKLKIAKDATFRQAMPLDTPMLASIFRKVSEAMVPMDSLQEWKRQKEAEISVSAEKHRNHKVEALERGIKERDDKLIAIEHITGQFNVYEAARIVACFKLAEQLLRGRGPNLIGHLTNVVNALERAAELKPAIEKAIAELQKETTA